MKVLMNALLPILLVLLSVAVTASGQSNKYNGGSASADQKDKKRENYGGTPGEYVPFGKFTNPYKQFFLQPLEYHGYGRRLPEPQEVTAVKIGFLGPIAPTVSVATGGASHEEPLGKMMLKGAQLAVEEANARGGYRKRGAGIPYELVVRNDNGLWGSSGNEIIHLAYTDDVRAILGTIDGANSHIAIRVALKIEIPMINTGDTDPTFTETQIPWVFRVITDDRRMCYALADYVFKKLKLTRVAALRANNRYGRIGIDEFRDAATRLGHPFLAELNYPIGARDFTPQLERIKALNPQVVITYGDGVESALILKQMRAMGMNQWFVGSDRMVFPEFAEIAGKSVSNVVAGFPYDPTSHKKEYREFVKRFRQRFNVEPETYAAHGYDGMAMLIRAISAAGLNRARIRDALAEMKTYDGVTGKKEFDPTYNNTGSPTLAIYQNGIWTYLSYEEAMK